MKKSILVAIAMSSWMAHGKVKTFTGQSKWTKSTCVNFSELEQLGVERSAEQNGVEVCQEAGAADCVILSSNTIFCNCLECDGQAVVRGLLN